MIANKARAHQVLIYLKIVNPKFTCIYPESYQAGNDKQQGDQSDNSVRQMA